MLENPRTQSNNNINFKYIISFKRKLVSLKSYKIIFAIKISCTLILKRQLTCMTLFLKTKQKGKLNLSKG